jgi:hypothetical protein
LLTRAPCSANRRGIRKSSSATVSSRFFCVAVRAWFDVVNPR